MRALAPTGTLTRPHLAVAAAALCFVLLTALAPAPAQDTPGSLDRLPQPGGTTPASSPTPTPAPLTLTPPRLAPTPPPSRPDVTPHPEVAAYQGEIKQAIGLSWRQAMAAWRNEGVELGHVKVHFVVLPSGALDEVSVVEGKEAAPLLARISVAALRAAKLPAMPAAVRARLLPSKERLEVSFTFTKE